MKGFLRGITATWEGAGQRPVIVALLVALLTAIAGGKSSLLLIAARLGQWAVEMVADMPEFSIAWSLVPLICLVAYGAGRKIRGLESIIAERESEREKAFEALSRERNEFIDRVLNNDPGDAASVETWCNGYAQWRDGTIAPLLEKAISKSRADLITRHGAVPVTMWRQDRDFRFNLVKSMMAKTLSEIEYAVKERK